MGYQKLVQAGRQIRVYRYQHDLSRQKVKRAERTKGLAGIKRVDRRQDNIYRLRERFQDIVRSNLVGDEEPVLVSLTMYEAVSVRKAYSLFTRFISRIRVKIARGLRYIAVPEFQTRGAVHFHVLLWGLADEYLLHEGSLGKERYGSRRRFAEWLARKGYGISEVRNDRNFQRAWRYGYCDLTPTDGDFRIAGYLAKYMRKSLLDGRLAGQKAYVCSRNVLRPVQTSFASVFQNLNEIVGDVLPVKVSRYEVPWLGSCVKEVYELSPPGG